MSSYRYRSVDHPELFDFHDSLFELDHVDEAEIAVYARGLNIHREAEENPKGYDLEIRRAHIVFRGIREVTYDPGRTWITDEHGNSVPVGPEILYRGEEALDRIKKDFLAGADIYSHTIVDGDYYEICGRGNEFFLAIRFKAREFAVEWEDYRGPAWYVLTRQYKREVVLTTPQGERTTQARFLLDYDPDELFRADTVDEVEYKEISVGLPYEGKNLWGRGKAAPDGMNDALAELQKQLPEGVGIKGLLSPEPGDQSP